MNVFLNENYRLLEKIETKQVQCLLNILSGSTIRRRQFIEDTYNEKAKYFQETTQFLQNIGWMLKEQDNLALTPDGNKVINSSQDDEMIRKHLIEAMAAENSPYRYLIADYLMQFKMMNDELTHRPSLTDRLQESSLRNLLIDLRIVNYKIDHDIYVLEEHGLDIYIWAINIMRSSSKENFTKKSKEKEEVGFQAELVILDYEKERLGIKWVTKIEHTSLKNPFACYDIKSVTVQNNESEPRYIEVKAVSNDSYQFYWTASEVETSKILRKKYFLYLIPVIKKEKFDVNRLLIIENPFVVIYENPQAWQIEENVIICRKKLIP